MKNLILNLLFALSLSSISFANNDPAKVILLESQDVVLSLSNADQINIFTTIDSNSNTIDFASNDEINFVQIFDEEGELQFQLMVDSKKVHLGKSLFKSGNYKLGFLIKGQSDVYFSDLEVK